MTVVLYRVDERLIHGQVVIGWANEIRPDRYLVVDDRLAGSAWEQELYTLAVPGDVETTFASVEEARGRIEHVESEPRRTVVLTRDIDSMARLAEGGLLSGRRVNLGGLHHGEGRVKVRSYLHLGDRDRAAIRRLLEASVEVTARDLPGSPGVEADVLLREGAE